MRSKNIDNARNAPQSLRTAQIMCLFFGVALLTWGLAPAIVPSLVTGHWPRAEAFTVGGLTICLGLSFLVLGVLVGRRVTWALWTVFLTSLALLLVTIALMAMGWFKMASVYPMLLSAGTAGASWLAVEARRTDNRAQHAPDVS